MWSGRFSQAGLAIESSQNETKLNELLSSNSAVGKVNRSRSECQRLLDRASDIRAKAEILKEEIATAKGEIESRTAAIARRRADLDALRTGLSMRRDRRLEEMRRAIQTLRLEWDRSYEETASHRAFLCMEAAQLYGLKRVRKGGAGRFEYRIGGVEIVDLFSMHGQ